ncbi:MAG: AAA family ATPase, partial [Anaerovorax sp.]
MDRKRLPIGIDSFEKIRDQEENRYYVDKTLFIKDLIDFKSEVNLFTRPRRFGKTLNMSMLKCFFEKDPKNSIGRPIDTEALFSGLAIMDAGEKYLVHMNRYPVIFLTLKSAKQPDWNLSHLSLEDEIIQEFHRHIGILESPALLLSEKERFMKMANRKADQEGYSKALQFLSKCLYKVYGEKVLILIDEYDVPLENAYFAGFYQEMIGFIRSLFESALKTNDSLAFAVLTGCLRISKESIFTGLNNLKIISVLDKKYGEYFGFTQDEVDDMLRNYGLVSKREEAKLWYDGYIFGETEVYNPWSIINYVDDGADVFPKAYWANTSGNSIVRKLVETAEGEVKAEIEELVRGGTVEKPIHEEITYGDIESGGDHLWNFLFFTGYLKKVSERFSEEGVLYVTMKIPNTEVKTIYENQIMDWFRDRLAVKDRSRLYEAVSKGDAGVFEEELSALLRASISYMDSYESFYHGFVAGVLTGMPDYLLKSNRESGNGRSDIAIRALTIRKPAIILELKTADKPRDLEKKCEEALEQIMNKKYDQELYEDGFDIAIHYGIAFFRKECRIKTVTVEL